MEAMEPSFRKNILNSPRILEGPWILIKKILCIFWLLPTCLLKSSTIFKTSFAIYVVCFPFYLNPLNLQDAPACRLGRVPGGQADAGEAEGFGPRGRRPGPLPRISVPPCAPGPSGGWGPSQLSEQQGAPRPTAFLELSPLPLEAGPRVPCGFHCVRLRWPSTFPFRDTETVGPEVR